MLQPTHLVYLGNYEAIQDEELNGEAAAEGAAMDGNGSEGAAKFEDGGKEECAGERLMVPKHGVEKEERERERRRKNKEKRTLFSSPKKAYDTSFETKLNYLRTCTKSATLPQSLRTNSTI